MNGMVLRVWALVLACAAAPVLASAERIELFRTDDDASGAFGDAVAIAENVIAVGAPDGFTELSRNGAVFVYERDPHSDEWEGVKLLAHDGKPGDLLGAAVALQGGTLVAGAPNVTVNGAKQAGAVYVFKRQAFGEWLQVAKLVADDPMPYAHFGSKVALDAGRVLVAAPDHISWKAVGAAYLFKYDHGASFWRQVRRFLPHDEVENSVFAMSVAISGNFIAIGRFGADSVYVYTTDGASWWKQTAIYPSLRSDTGSGAGWEVALQGNVLAIAAPEDLPPNAPEDYWTSGVVHVFEFINDAWTRTATLAKGFDPASAFGAGLAMGNGYIAATSWRESEWNAVFRKNAGGEWVEDVAFLKRDINELLPIAVSNKYVLHPIWPLIEDHGCVVVYKLADLKANPDIYNSADCVKPAQAVISPPPNKNPDDGNPDDNESPPTGGSANPPPSEPTVTSGRTGGGSAGFLLLSLLGALALRASKCRVEARSANVEIVS